MKTPKPRILELSVKEWEGILQHAESGLLRLNVERRHVLVGSLCVNPCSYVALSPPIRPEPTA